MTKTEDTTTEAAQPQYNVNDAHDTFMRIMKAGGATPEQMEDGRYRFNYRDEVIVAEVPEGGMLMLSNVCAMAPHPRATMHPRAAIRRRPALRAFCKSKRFTIQVTMVSFCKYTIIPHNLQKKFYPYDNHTFPISSCHLHRTFAVPSPIFR